MSATETKPLELIVSVKGEIIKSNFDDFESYALDQLSAINTDLNTDEDFGQAAADEKSLKDAESKFREVEAQILAEMDAVSDLINRTRGLGAKYAETRLTLSKELKSRKAIIIAGIKSDAVGLVSIKHPQASPRIDEAMKNKRTLTSLKQSAEAEALKIEAEVSAAREVVNEFITSEGRDIVYDEHALLVQDSELVRVELSRRVERKLAAIKEAELKAEAEKLKAEARAKADAEACEDVRKTEAPQVTDAEEIAETKVPVPSVGETAENELARYISGIRVCLQPFRSAREALRFPVNIERAAEFANTLNAAFAKLKGGAQ